jgi:hypothetical protein
VPRGKVRSGAGKWEFWPASTPTLNKAAGARRGIRRGWGVATDEWLTYEQHILIEDHRGQQILRLWAPQNDRLVRINFNIP